MADDLTSSHTDEDITKVLNIAERLHVHAKLTVRENPEKRLTDVIDHYSGKIVARFDWEVGVDNPHTLATYFATVNVNFITATLTELLKRRSAMDPTNKPPVPWRETPVVPEMPAKSSEWDDISAIKVIAEGSNNNLSIRSGKHVLPHASDIQLSANAIGEIRTDLSVRWIVPLSDIIVGSRIYSYQQVRTIVRDAFIAGLKIKEDEPLREDLEKLFLWSDPAAIVTGYSLRQKTLTVKEKRLLVSDEWLNKELFTREQVQTMLDHFISQLL